MPLNRQPARFQQLLEAAAHTQGQKNCQSDCRRLPKPESICPAVESVAHPDGKHVCCFYLIEIMCHFYNAMLELRAVFCYFPSGQTLKKGGFYFAH